MSKKNLIALAATLLSVAACGTNPTPTESDDDRVLIYQHVKNIVSGSIKTEGLEISFSLERDNDAIFTRLVASDGLVLVDTKVENGAEITTLLGAHTFAGEPGRVTSFDTDVLADLAAMPEMALVPELKKQLDAAGVDPSLLAGLSGEGQLGEILCPTVREPTRWNAASSTEITDRK